MDREKDLKILDAAASKPYHEIIEDREAAEEAERQAIIHAERLVDEAKSDEEPCYE